jgi:hypothetical protein
MSKEYANLADLLKPLRTRKKLPYPNQKKFSLMRKNFNQDKQPEWQIAVF